MENLLLGNVIESGNISPFSCPFCGYNGSLDLMGADRFPVLRTLQVIGAGRRAARCPKCKSSDKERLVYTYLKEVEKIEKTKGLSILHIAPESNLQIWLQSISDKYIAGDAFLQNQKFIGKVQFVDIRQTEFCNNQFDYIIQVPITKISKTVEYPNVYTKEEREVVYGYGYHERIYNDKEYVKLLTSVGFVVEVYNISARYNKNGLNPLEDLYICKKK